MSIGTETRETRALSLDRIHQGDCLELLRQVEDGTIDLVFADPPFNIGYDYDAYHDRHDDETYTAWCRDWITEIHRVLKPEGAFWLAIGDEYAAELKVAAQHQVGFFTRSWIVWYYTFGVNCKRKFSRSHVHLFHFVKDENRFTFNADDPLCRVPSARALVYGDKRANPAGRLPDDTWIVRPAADDNWVLRPQDLPEGFQPTDDTWYFARVAGTFKERQGFHGCQMPEQLLGRIVRVSSNPDDIVLDPFAGSGTTLAVAKKLRRRWIGCELSEEYVRAATERLNSIKPGDALDGAADPIASAPSTANGRRLETFNPRESITDAEQSRTDAERRLPPLPLGAGWGEGDSRSGPDPLPTNLRSVPGEGMEEMAPKGEGMAKSHLVEKAPATPSVKRELRELVREAIVEAFFATHEGYSTDWLLANPQLQQAYHEACREAGLIGSPADWNRELLRLRKQGAIPKRGEIKKIQLDAKDLDACGFAAEIAWRISSDKFGGPSLDEIFCDPAKAETFDRTAKRFAPGFEATEYRWAALKLRKAGKSLVADVKQFHFVFAKRDFARFQKWPGFKPTRFAGQPGIYLLRGADRAPLYVGKSLDLGQRLTQHAASKEVAGRAAHVSVLTGAELPGEEYRDAFKQDLVRRHQPRWNVNLVGLHTASE